MITDESNKKEGEQIETDQKNGTELKSDDENDNVNDDIDEVGGENCEVNNEDDLSVASEPRQEDNESADGDHQQRYCGHKIHMLFICLSQI